MHLNQGRRPPKWHFAYTYGRLRTRRADANQQGCASIDAPRGILAIKLTTATARWLSHGCTEAILLARGFAIEMVTLDG
jgi:hypothetical protein